jgi:signal transduction histidine kinase
MRAVGARRQPEPDGRAEPGAAPPEPEPRGGPEPEPRGGLGAEPDPPDRRLLAGLPDGVLTLDASGVVTWANRALLRLSGRPAGQVVGACAGDLIEWHGPDGALAADPTSWPAAARWRGVRAIVPQPAAVRLPGGERLAVTLAGGYLRDGAGRLAGAVLTLRPPARSGRRNPGGMEIVSTVSHELRSPLTSVKGYTSLMLNRWERLAEEQKKMMLEQVNHDADRVTRLITELLDISRLETGRLILRRQLVDLPQLASSVVEKVRMEYPELEATTAFPPAFPRVYADPDKIEQVLTNLVENACKYASPRGLRIDGSVEDGAVSVGVHDRGEGIPRSDLPKVFTKFFRREVGRPTGSGLGLWISRGLVESHGGELRADSVEGRGSTFRFTLPLIDLDELQSS